MITVFIIDDHQIIIDGIINHLSQNDEINIVGSSTNPVNGIAEIAKLKPNIILLDISMPKMNGFECANEILKLEKDAKIIFLSTHQEISIVKKAIKSGIKGYLSKATGLSSIGQAIKKVYNSEIYIGEEITQLSFGELINPNNKKQNSFIPKLTKRENEILLLIADEATTEEISKALFISKNTVETHRRNLISKFQVRNSVGLVKSAIELGII